MGMVHSGLSSMHAILKESASEDDSASSERGGSGFPIAQGCNMVTLAIPITTTLPLEGTLADHPNGSIVDRRTTPQMVNVLQISKKCWR
jgi:hypothetical protein